MGGRSSSKRSIFKGKNPPFTSSSFSLYLHLPLCCLACQDKVHRLWSVKGGSWECERKEGDG